MSAKIFRLDDFRSQDVEDQSCDIVTAVDVAIRDLREIIQDWGTDTARARALECERMLTHVLAGDGLPPQL